MTFESGAYVPDDLLQRLVGFRLYSVQFVMDHVQLRFDDGPTSVLADHPNMDLPVLTCLVMPTVRTAGGHLADGDAGYTDALRTLILSEVVATSEATGTGIEVQFERATIVVHPRADQLVGPEIALLTGFEDRQWMCWRPGEDSFADLV